MERLYYVGVIKSGDNNDVWAFAGGYDTEEKAVTACGDNELAFVNVIDFNSEIDPVWETDKSKLGYYPALEPEKIGSLTAQA